MLVRSLLKHKKINKGGSIVFTASAAGVYRVSIGNGIYATTKCGIDAFMRTVALEFGPKGIRCNSESRDGRNSFDFFFHGRGEEERNAKLSFA